MVNKETTFNVVYPKNNSSSVVSVVPSASCQSLSNGTNSPNIRLSQRSTISNFDCNSCLNEADGLVEVNFFELFPERAAILKIKAY
jgi:hypothetical protein